jgi:tetratricopeptide (TPR) repeat protein
VQVLQVSLAVVLASLVLGFTLVKNANYAMAEDRATSAAGSLDDDQLEIAMQAIDGAIALAPDVGRYHVIRANILDQTRNSTAASAEHAGLAIEAYQTNGRAVTANPFDIYSRLHFAESVSTLATLGYPGKGPEAIEEYRLLTSLQPRFWLSHFLLGRAYVDMGEPGHAVEAFTEAIDIDPLSPSFYDRRSETYEMLGEHSLAVDDHGRGIKLSPLDHCGMFTEVWPCLY